MWTCARGHAENKDDDSFCIECGRPANQRTFQQHLLLCLVVL